VRPGAGLPKKFPEAGFRVRIATFGIATFGIATFGIATFGIATFGIATFGIKAASRRFQRRIKQTEESLGKVFSDSHRDKVRRRLFI
jgi:hypothetical protein